MFLTIIAGRVNECDYRPCSKCLSTTGVVLFVRTSVVNCFIGINTIFAPLSARMFALLMDRRTVDYDPNPRSIDGQIL